MKIETTFGRSEQKGAYVYVFIPEAPEESRDIHLHLNDSDQKLREKMEMFSSLEVGNILTQCKEIIASADKMDIPPVYETLLHKMEKQQMQATIIKKGSMLKF